MLIRTDPFRELDRLTQQILGTTARPAAMAMDAFRKGDTFYVLFDLPGIKRDSIDLTVEQNILTVHAERPGPASSDVEMLVAERPAGAFTRQVFLGETLDADHMRTSARHLDGVLAFQAGQIQDSERRPRLAAEIRDQLGESDQPRTARPRRINGVDTASKVNVRCRPGTQSVAELLFLLEQEAGLHLRLIV